MNTRNPLKALVLAPIVVWSRWISPGLPPRCKYEPSCSKYAIQAITELGILRGLVLTGWRLLRCNPWSHGGVDKIADQTLFKVGVHPTNCQHEAITQQ